MFPVKPKTTRASNLVSMINEVLQSGLLPHAQAASLLGKFGFLCSAMFGKVGRGCTALFVSISKQTQLLHFLPI